jgi:hypothetical protein
MHRSRVLAAVLLLSLLGMAPSSHANIWCNGTITGVLTDNAGNVMAYTTFRNDWLQVCNIRAAWKGVAVEVCKAWIAKLTTLRVTQEPATVFYTDYADGSSCLAIPNYGGAAAPNYIAISTP